MYRADNWLPTTTQHGISSHDTVCNLSSNEAIGDINEMLFAAKVAKAH